MGKGLFGAASHEEITQWVKPPKMSFKVGEILRSTGNGDFEYEVLEILEGGYIRVCPTDLAFRDMKYDVPAHVFRRVRGPTTFYR